MEKHYTFLTGNRVVDNLVFAEKDDELAQRICNEKGYEQFMWMNDAKIPVLWSTYSVARKEFTGPTNTHLQFLGVLNGDNPVADTYDAKWDMFVPNGTRYNPIKKTFETLGDN